MNISRASRGKTGAAGELLGKVERSVQWWLCDWWAYGESRYGQRKAIVEAEDWQGPEFGTCMNAARVCRAFETSRRREVLYFKHHNERKTDDTYRKYRRKQSP